MANYYGSINLDQIPNEMIQRNPKGERIVFINVNEKGDNEWGVTHSIAIGVPKAQRQPNQRKIFIGNLKESAPFNNGNNGGGSPYGHANNTARASVQSAPSVPRVGAEDLPF